jgi:hypothetical protein
MTFKPIKLESVRMKLIQDKCKHRDIVVDDELKEVECNECKKLLNPVFVLMSLIQENNRLIYSGRLYKKVMDKIKMKKRIRCPNCKKFFDIK